MSYSIHLWRTSQRAITKLSLGLSFTEAELRLRERTSITYWNSRIVHVENIHNRGLQLTILYLLISQ